MKKLFLLPFFVFVFTTDAFTGQPFQPGRNYSFTAIAYGHNAY